jgi:hypothetical protein
MHICVHLSTIFIASLGRSIEENVDVVEPRNPITSQNLEQDRVLFSGEDRYSVYLRIVSIVS